MSKWRIVVAVALACATGCGDSGDDDSRATATGVEGCKKACASIAKAACPQDDAEAECVEHCEAELSELSQCKVELDGVSACVAAASLSCTSYGNATVLTTCWSKAVALDACVGCAPANSDSACEACSKKSCCTERSAIYTNAESRDYIVCQDECTDQACIDACKAKYASAWTALQALITCETDNCTC